MSTDAIEALLETTARERESAIPRNGSQEADRGHDHGRRGSDSDRDRDRERDRYPTHSSGRRDDRDRGGRSREYHRDRDYRDRDGDRYQPGNDRRGDRDYDRNHRERSMAHSSRSGDEGDRRRPRHDVYVPSDSRDSRRLSRDRSRSPVRGDSYRSRGNNRRQRSPVRKRTPEPTEDERDRRTIFVQQLAARLRTRELIEFFSKVGPVKDAQIVKDRVSNRSKGVGYVEFRDEESVPKAIQLTGKTLKGIPIIAQLTEAEKNRQARVTEGSGNANNGVPYHRLYVGNIHFSITEDDLRSVFEPFGELEFVQLQKEETGRSKGYGFVQFHDSNSAKLALEQLNGFELANRPIRVGLGNDKFTAESTANLLRNFNAPNGPYQGSSFSGSGGRGATVGGPNTFDRAGGRDDRGTGGASALDDTDVAGVNFNNYSREALMQKLMHREEKHSGQEGYGNSSKVSTTIVSSKKPQEYTGFAMASRCVKISNAFDPEEETGEWIKEIEGEMHDELSKFGNVIHVRLDPNSSGDVYVKFDKVSDGEKAVQRLNGRLYNHRMLAAAPMADKIYDSINSTRRVSSDM